MSILNDIKCILESILLEDKLKDLQQQNYHIHPDTIKDIWENGVPKNNQGRYINWSLKENTKSFDPKRTRSALEIYDRNKDKIGKFNHQWSINDLERVVHPYTDEGKSFNKKAEDGTHTEYEDEHLIVRRHDSHESAVKAAQLHPSNSCYNNLKEPGKAAWCVSLGGDVGKMHFNHYTKNGESPMYTVENKKDKRKTALVFPDELRDEHDNSLSLSDVMKKHPTVHKTPSLSHHFEEQKLLDDVKNQNASEDTLLRGINHPAAEIQQAAMNNPNATEKVIHNGITRENLYNTVTRNYDLPEHILFKLAGNKDSNVAKEAIRHNNATERVLLKGAEHPDHTVSAAAASSYKASEKVINKVNEHKDIKLLKSLHRDNNPSEEDFMKGVTHSHPSIKQSAINHPNVSENVLLRATKDSNIAFAHMAVEHPNATEKVLQSVANRPDIHENAKKEIIKRLEAGNYKK